MQKTYERGAHLKVDGLIYAHHGIYVGNGEVIHHPGSGSSGSFIGARAIEIISLEEFRGGQKVEVVATPNGDAELEAQIVERAYSSLGSNDYDLLSNNCEHFAFWCYGFAKSEQVDAISGFSAMTAGAVLGATAGPAGMVVGGIAGLVAEILRQES